MALIERRENVFDDVLEGIRIEMFSMRIRLTIASGVTSHTTDKRNMKKN